MYPFATHLITLLAGALLAALYASHHVERREIAEYTRGYNNAKDDVTRQHRERGKKAAQTRKERKVNAS
jgi:hypothetical protein